MDDAVTPTAGTLKKNRTRLLLGAIVVTVAGFAIAASAGRYYCSECKFDEALAFGDTEIFIRSEVNKHVNSWVDSKGNALDVTICNGSQCATYLYRKLSSVWILQKLENSNWRGDDVGVGGGGGGDMGDWGGHGGGIGGPSLGGGCVGRCNGDVEVGPIQQI